ncbi:MAG: DUF4041 domain-containing protein [Pirellulaceae bacterium]
MLALFLSVVVMLETAAIIALLVMFFASQTKLKRYSGIANAEAHQSACQQQAQQAMEQFQAYTSQSNALIQQLTSQKGQVAQYQKLLGNLKTAADLQQRIQNDTARAQQIAASLSGLEHAAELSAYIQSQQVSIEQHQAQLNSYAQALGNARSAAEIAAQVTYYQNLLAVAKAEVDSVEEARGLQEFGFYRPRYNFDSSEEYEQRLDQVREQQKWMLSQKTACICSTEWTVNGNRREGQKMQDKQIKLMLRAFNGECDAAVGKVRYNNAVSLENRIRKSFEAVNKLGETQCTSLTPDYCNLKCDELHLAHEYQQKKQDEKEEQRALREQMREEEKVQLEIERAKEEAEEQEEIKTRALAKARAELEQKAGKQNAKLESLIERLENELHDVLDRKAKAIARAQLTRSGHVYILSNVGAFGDGVHKIGMSRRLVPQERVDELGGASVPFPYDVHAMIYCEDAPKLENMLHRHFASRRVNMINLRREFFRVSLDEIRAAIAEHHAHVTFVTIPEAEQYRQTLAMLKEQERQPQQLQIA